MLDSFIKPILGAGASLLAGRSLPQIDGQISLPGLNQPVEIFRDSLGVPHIYARNQEDLLFAQGFVHAQDRLWQMDFHRRVAYGRLAEILGSQGLPVDRWIRILGFARAAQGDYDLLDAEMLSLLEAYSAGVNARISQKNYPVEFSLLSYQPDPWTPMDTLTWGKLMTWMQSGNWECELIRAALIEQVGPEKAAELELGGETSWPDASLVVTAGLQVLRNSRSAEELSGPTSIDGIGSNNWVIGGNRTTSGKPLLANDMHLQLSAPAIWYENHLSGGGFDVTGVSLPGIPMVMAGHNGTIAWGFTDSFADVQDLYIENLRRESDGRVFFRSKGVWKQAQVFREEIQVKRGEPVIEDVVVTDHGPVVNSLFEEIPISHALALKWTSHSPEKNIQVLFQMNRAQTGEDFREALRDWGGPALNLVWADISGKIGYRVIGNLPKRKKGSGRVPMSAEDGEAEWEGFIPFDEMPECLDPPQGYVATANNRMVDLTYPYDLGDDYSSADRALRIGELIQAKEKVDIQWVQQMQYDLVSPTARQIAAALGLIKVDDPALSSIIEKFAAWDGTLATDSQEALIYENFATRLIHHLVEGHLGSLTKNYLGRGPTPAIAEHSMWGFRAWEWLVKIIGEPESHWFNMGNGEKRDDILLLVLRETIEDLNNRLGPNHSEWTWGKQHTLSFKHTLGQARLLNLFFNRGPYPIGGDGSTVWASFAIPTKDSSGIIGPPFRFIADLSDLNHCQGMLAPGQSGQPASPHYDDQIDAWLKGEYHTMWYLRADVESHASQRLELIPA